MKINYCNLLSFFVFVFVFVFGAKAAEDFVAIVSYDFDWAVGGQDTLSPAGSVPVITASPISRGAAFGGFQAAFTLDALGTQPGAATDDSRFLAPYPVETAVDGDAYFEFTLEVAEGHLMSINRITLGSRRASHNSGPNFMALRSSLDDFESNAVTGVSTAGPGGTVSNSAVLELGSAFANLSGGVTFRLYGYGRNRSDQSRGIWAISNPYSNATVQTDEGSVTYGPEGVGPMVIEGSTFEIPEGGFLLTIGRAHTGTPKDGFGGSTDPSGAVAFEEVTEVQVMATPVPGYLFESWSGDVTSTDNPLSLTMNTNYDITANFGPDTADDDGDGLTNYEEIHIYGTDPNNPDTSGDGILDGEAVAVGLNPLNDLSHIVEIVRNRPGGFGLFAESEIQDFRFGGIILEADSEGAATMQFSVEESADLLNWIEHESFVSEFSLPAERRFLRVRAAGASQDP